MNEDEIKNKALENAREGKSIFNYDAIIKGFIKKNIPEEEIQPRVNVFTFNAWKGLG